MIKFLYLLICFLLPNVIWQMLNSNRQKRRKKTVRHIVLTYLFCVYCAVAVHIAGTGTLWDLIANKGISGGFRWIPFSANGIKEHLVNMFLLMPLGFLLPFIWKEFRKFGNACLAGLGFSLLIEFFQIFGSNTTAVDDVLMNTLGASAGYLLWMLYGKLLGVSTKPANRKNKAIPFWKTEPAKRVLLGFLGVFLLFSAALTGNHPAKEGNVDGLMPSDMATIVFDDGTVEEWNCNDLLNEYFQDPRGFDQRFVGAKITFVDSPRVSEVCRSSDSNKRVRRLTFANGWQVEFSYKGYKFLDKAEKEGREIVVAVESFITGVYEYEKNKFVILLGSWEEGLAEQTVITEVQ